MTVSLRPYQVDMVTGFRTAFQARHRRVLGQLATGGGKGRLLGHMARAVSAKGKRILIVAHRAELVNQICANLDAEDVPYGRVQPSWPMLRYPVLVGMVQTVARRLNKLPTPDLLMIDEAHHAPAGQYVAMAKAWPDARVLGVTATPARTDGVGLREHFDVMVQGPSMADLIAAGHLADYDYYLPSPDFDAAEIGISMGDYRPGETLRAMSKAKIVGDAVQHYRRYLQGRPAIAFCMGVDHTHAVAAEFRAAGLRAAGVDGTMTLDERAARLSALGNGSLDVLTAADVISEGVDIPQVAGAILLRPTTSVALFLQQCGRALRAKPDGSRAVILDHVGNAKRHGLPADPRAWSLDGEPKRDAPELRECDTCFRAFARPAAVHTAQAECERARAADPDDPCSILTPPRIVAARGQGGVIPGELEAARDPWAWAGGIDPLRAAGREYAALLERAQTEDQLRMIARARGYKRGWTAHILRQRAAMQRVAA